MRLALTLLAALCLSACSLAPTAPARAVYDLGPAPTAAAPGGKLAWRLADVTAPPWLGGEGIAYRLSYRQAQRLEQYRDSVWAAPPAALLAQRLREQLTATPGCVDKPASLLGIHLDEFEQVFSSATNSQAVLRVHATLWPAGGGAALQQHWRLERPAPPDAPGAVRALAQTVDDWLPQLSSWLGAACR